MPEHSLLIALTLVAALGVAAQWLAWRLHAPAIVLLTLFGLLAGPVFGWIAPSRDLGEVLHPLIQIGVAIILFEGGLNLRFHELRQAAKGVRRLITVGVALSFGLGSLAAHVVGGLSWPVALEFGAIIVVTGPTVIIPLLRQARLHRRPASYLKWEGIVNDPTGALLAVLVFEYFSHFHTTGGLETMLPRLGIGVLISAALGLGGGLLLGNAYRRGYVPEYLKGPIAIAAALGVYTVANLVLDEAGLLAVTLLGLVLGNMRLPSIQEIRRFKENIAILLVSGIFLLLTADLDPRILLNLDWRSLALILSILFLVRPLSIYLSTIGAGMRWQERALLAWIAPRGVVAAAVAGVVGPQMQAMGYAGSELLLPLVFCLIFVTVVAHGFSIGWVARRLGGLSADSPNRVLIAGANPWSTDLARILHETKVPVILVDASWHRLRRARLAGIPVYFGELLSESAEQSLEFNDVGNLYATTDNDAYNTLVCGHFGHELGRTHVFQLPIPGADGEPERQVARPLRGMRAPAVDAVYEDLESCWYRGCRFRKTHLTEQFGFADWRAGAPGEAIVVVLVQRDGQVRFNSVEAEIAPGAGDTVIWYGAKQETVGRSCADTRTLDRQRDFRRD